MMETNHIPPRVNAMPGTLKTILLADDEPMALEVGRRILQCLGYQVIVARDGLEAVTLYRDRLHEIDLVILDVQMPRLNGPQAFEQIRTLNRDVKVLVVTGSYSEDIANDMLAQGVAAILQKPYQVDQLAQAVRQVLDSARLERPSHWRAS
jgi:CheY-like chemotaxis protein